jgi:hypothetical protein
VEKLHVTAFAEIVGDVGADWGVRSARSASSVAIRIAYKSSVTFTSLAELRENAAEELLTLRLSECRLPMVVARRKLERNVITRDGDGEQYAAGETVVRGRQVQRRQRAGLGERRCPEGEPRLLAVGAQERHRHVVPAHRD